MRKYLFYIIFCGSFFIANNSFSQQTLKTTNQNNDSLKYYLDTIPYYDPVDTIQYYYKYVYDVPLIIPNAFSPNGDGINDVFFIQGTEIYPDIQLSIFNQKGFKVYERFGGYLPDDFWDGGGNPEGVYYYILKLNSPNATDDLIQGYITLVRTQQFLYR